MKIITKRSTRHYVNHDIVKFSLTTYLKQNKQKIFKKRKISINLIVF